LWVNNFNYVVLVKEVRVQLGLSQEDLARELGVSYATINRWENGRFSPSRLAVRQLETYCDRMIGLERLVLSGYKK